MKFSILAEEGLKRDVGIITKALISCVYAKIRFSHDMDQMSLVVRKPVFGVSDQVRHKPGCTATEDGEKLEISYLGSRGIVLSV